MEICWGERIEMCTRHPCGPVKWAAERVGLGSKEFTRARYVELRVVGKEMVLAALALNGLP